MSEEKYEIKEFSFKSLIPESGDVENFEAFELQSLNEVGKFKNGITEEIIRNERNASDSSAFNFLPEVAEYRGINRQAQDDYEKAVRQEVDRQLQALKEQAYQDGLQQGLEEGKAKAYQESQDFLSAKVDEFVQQLAETQDQINNILLSSKHDAYNIVKNLSKWIVLKDIEEKYYLARLLEKLIHEVNQKNNLVIHVNEEAFGYMPEIVKIVERKVGKLENARLEIDLDLKENGIKLETENCIIDGSLDAQFKAIDELFKSVGLDDAS